MKIKHKSHRKLIIFYGKDGEIAGTNKEDIQREDAMIAQLEKIASIGVIHLNQQGKQQSIMDVIRMSQPIYKPK